MFVLYLNPMRGNAEQMVAIARAETIEPLRAYLEQEAVEPYRDDRWWKAYRQGGPLEWYNPPLGESGYVDVGTFEDQVEKLRLAWAQDILRLPEKT